MIHSLTINIDSKRILITSADGSVLSNVPNIVALYGNDKPAIIGKTPEMFQEQAPKEWEQVKDKIRFCNLFSVDDFRPELAASTIDYLVYLATHPSVESQKKWAKDTITLQANILDYEKLNADIQELFEYYIHESSHIKVKSLLINNQVKTFDFDKIRWAKWSAGIGFLTVPVLIFLSMFFLARATLGEQFLPPYSSDNGILFLAVFAVVLIFLVYFAIFMFIVVWKFATKNLVSNTISRVIIERYQSFPKPLTNLVWQKTTSNKNGGG
jgi:hypothetical protein